ncbi:MAG: GntR family transcriptional regulator [Phycisphaerae bacterium]|nr:GntR family transcriptional regulator [Phycisphaerae bacterium]
MSVAKEETRSEGKARNGPDFRSASPLYAQARVKIEDMISDGNFAPNDQLPTVRQISSRIGISRATTSKAIIQMIEEGILSGRQGKGVFLNHPPGLHVASELKTVYVLSGGKPTDGYIEDYLAHTPFWNQFVTGIHQEFSANHDTIRLRFAMLPHFVEEEDVAPRKRRWDEIGIIITDDPTPENLEKILRLRTSLVMVHCRSHPEEIPQVKADFVRGCEKIVDHLAGLGHRRILFCGETRINSSNTGGVDLEKITGFKHAMKKHGLPFDEDWNLRECNFGTEEGYRVARSILGGTELPTAMVMCNDELAIGAVRAIQESGLSVPNDISVTGFDNISIGKFVMPSLTTIDTRMLEIGRISVQKLFRVHEGGSRDSVALAPELIARESTGPVNTENQ